MREIYVRGRRKQYTEQEVLAKLNRLTRFIYFHPEKIGPNSHYKNVFGLHFFFVEEWLKNDDIEQENSINADRSETR